MGKRILLRNIGELYPVAEAGVRVLRGTGMAAHACLKEAWLLVKDSEIHSLGLMGQSVPDADEIIDCTGRLVIPGFCDSHTHIIFAASRHEEFVHRIQGLSYEEIARRGGGILNSATRLQQAGEQELFRDALARTREMLSTGTTAFEVKSGYGLTLASELKMLRVAAMLRDSVPQQVRITFLGAHAFPAESRENRDAYVELVIKQMLPAVHAEGLAQYVDVFCDKGFFSPEQTSRILDAAAKFGLRPKIHANELANSGGVQVGTQYHAVSVDHLEEIGPEEIEILAQAETIATALPNCSFFLGIPYAPVRALVDAGAAVALASDFNPGSSPSGNMHLVMAAGCARMKLLPSEALAACTINGAAAMDISDTSGSLSPGKLADLIITKPYSTLAEMPYYFGNNPVWKLMIGGVLL